MNKKDNIKNSRLQQIIIIIMPSSIYIRPSSKRYYSIADCHPLKAQGNAFPSSRMQLKKLFVKSSTAKKIIIQGQINIFSVTDPQTLKYASRFTFCKISHPPCNLCNDITILGSRHFQEGLYASIFFKHHMQPFCYATKLSV